jgi:hypothetical protein
LIQRWGLRLLGGVGLVCACVVAWVAGIALLWDQNPAERTGLEETLGWILFLGAPIVFVAVAVASVVRWRRERQPRDRSQD